MLEEQRAEKDFLSNAMTTLKNKAEFDFVYKNAKKYSSETFNLYILNLSHPSLSQKSFSYKQRRVLSLLQNQELKPFLGMSVSKKIGNSPQRNKIKRRFRAICRTYEKQLKNLAIIFMAKEGNAQIDFQTLQIEVLKYLIPNQSSCKSKHKESKTTA